MAAPLLARARAATVLVAVALLAGCTSFAGEDAPVVTTPSPPAGPTPPSPDAPAPKPTLALLAMERALNVSPGAALATGVIISNTGAAAANVTLDATGADDVAIAEMPALLAEGGYDVGVWLTLLVDANATPGERRLTLVGRAPGHPDATAEVALRVLAPGPGVAEGGAARVEYVGLLADGRMFNTNMRAYDNPAFARAEFYRSSVGTPEFIVETGDRPNVIFGFAHGILGMRAGESRTIQIPPEDGYGPAAELEIVDRRTVVEREYVFPSRNVTAPFTAFADHVEETGQGDAQSFGPGDTFTFEQGGNLWRFRVVNVTETTITYLPAPNVGDRFTLDRAWPKGAEVVASNDSAITFYLTPTTGVNETLTYLEYWPNATVLESLNATHVVLLHTPAVGLAYEEPGAPGDRPERMTVERVEDARIVVARHSANPLAGETLVFTVRVVALVGA